MPEVLCIDSADLADDSSTGRSSTPRFITEDSRLRRRMYQADIERNRAEAEFVGPDGGVPRHPGHGLHHRARRARRT